MAKLPLDEFLIETIEGRGGPMSVTLADGRLAFAENPAQPGTQPDARLLAEFLRSDEPIGAEIRAWLADMLDEGATTQTRIHLKWRDQGRRSDPTINWHIAEFVEHLIEVEQRKQEAAVEDAKDRFGVGRTAIMAALRSRRAAFEEHRAITTADLEARDD